MLLLLLLLEHSWPLLLHLRVPHHHHGLLLALGVGIPFTRRPYKGVDHFAGKVQHFFEGRVVTSLKMKRKKNTSSFQLNRESRRWCRRRTRCVERSVVMVTKGVGKKGGGGCLILSHYLLRFLSCAFSLSYGPCCFHSRSIRLGPPTHRRVTNDPASWCPNSYHRGTLFFLSRTTNEDVCAKTQHAHTRLFAPS